MPRILVAEDDEDLRALIVSVLRNDGYDVLEARDGREAIDHLSDALFLERGDAPPDLIITDVRMPGITGLSLLAGVRAYGWRTPIIIVTAFDLENVRSEARHLGADVVLSKPLDTGELRRLVRDLLAPKASGTHLVHGAEIRKKSSSRP